MTPSSEPFPLVLDGHNDLPWALRRRAGSDIAFLGGLINYVLTNEAHFLDYVRTYTNAALIVGEEFRDTYTEALQEIIEAKREHHELPEAPEPAEPGRVVDLMAALQESVQKAKASRGEDADVHDLTKTQDKTAKKTPSKRQAGTRKKTAAKAADRKPRRSA